MSRMILKKFIRKEVMEVLRKIMKNGTLTAGNRAMLNKKRIYIQSPRGRRASSHSPYLCFNSLY